MSEVPLVRGFTIPVEPMVATERVEELHTPPVTELLNVEGTLVHSNALPVTGIGAGSTVM
jgi:hypothetical protein